jgi:hypothetical protein
MNHNTKHTMSMQLSEPKRDLLVYISGGFQVLFACSFAADEIGAGDKEIDEDLEDKESMDQRKTLEFIRTNMLKTGKSMVGMSRYWFSGNKLEKAFKNIKTRADEDLIIKAFALICDFDICVGEAFDESCADLDGFKNYVGAGWTNEHLLLFSAFEAKKIQSHDEFMSF